MKQLDEQTATITLDYCDQCGWMLRAAWMAQDLLVTFRGRIREIILRPGKGGIFEVRVNGDLVWSRAARGRFPDITELKQLVRDHIAPDMSLGHADRKPSSE
ncbi:MAG TPA: Rdx family protein [Candidatus Hydrogenedentes bacterium]|nr:Rdx family protein [Candidatus Hydrogenedentota bacterium]HPU99188.1 Rdx family protein [Candidatus Hydrogenedentota bacterium]